MTDEKKYELKFTNRFKKYLKLAGKRNPKNIKKIHDTVDILQKGEPLPERFCDHELAGNYARHRECHVLKNSNRCSKRCIKKSGNFRIIYTFLDTFAFHAQNTPMLVTHTIPPVWNSQSRISLWDVLRECEITGASDSSIKKEIPNDFSEILASSKIDRIFCTGKTAFNLYKKHCPTNTARHFPTFPSSCPVKQVSRR